MLEGVRISLDTDFSSVDLKIISYIILREVCDFCSLKLQEGRVLAFRVGWHVSFSL